MRLKRICIQFIKLIACKNIIILIFLILDSLDPVPKDLQDILVTTTTITTTATAPTIITSTIPKTTIRSQEEEGRIIERPVMTTERSVLTPAKKDEQSNSSGGKSLGAGLVIGLIMSLLIFFALGLALLLYLKR